MINGLKEWMNEVEAMGELKTFSGVSDVLEMGALTMLALEKNGGKSPALLFENIPGYSSDYRVLTNSIHSDRRIALTCGVEAAETKQGRVAAWRGFVDSPRLIPPKKVSSGPILENVLRDDEIDLTVLPAPVWHELDRGESIHRDRERHYPQRSG